MISQFSTKVFAVNFRLFLKNHYSYFWFTFSENPEVAVVCIRGCWSWQFWMYIYGLGCSETSSMAADEVATRRIYTSLASKGLKAIQKNLSIQKFQLNKIGKITVNTISCGWYNAPTWTHCYERRQEGWYVSRTYWQSTTQSSCERQNDNESYLINGGNSKASKEVYWSS